MKCTAPGIISLSPLSLSTDVTDVTLGTSGLWLGTRTGAGGTAIVTRSFFDCTPMAPWTTGQTQQIEYTKYKTRAQVDAVSPRM